MGNSCIHVERPAKNGYEKKRKMPCTSAYVYAEEKDYGVRQRPRLEGQDRDVEEVRLKIDGLNGSDMAAFHALTRKDILWFLERSLSDKEKIHSRGIRRIERKAYMLSNTANVHPYLSLHVVTWNMNGKVACEDLGKLVGGRGESSLDLYVIGLQEVPNCINATSLILNALGGNYSLVAASVMVSLQLFIFARTVMRPFINDVRVDKVGIGGLGGVVRRHKGAVGVAFKYKHTSFLFIACHLSPHESNVGERNVQYQRICHAIFSKARRSPNGTSNINLSPACKTAVGQSDVVVWLGDLNYRIEGNRKSVSFLINQNHQKLLRAKDQLCREAERGEIFHGFCEGPLSFRPTYKYDIGTDNYDTSAKERVPSWTDRILYKVKNNNIKADVQEYDCIDSIKTSDHRPVKALLTIHLAKQLVK
ncbi:hypothetical protein KI387_006211 [Taxus chinensis]|uniref:Inositol polyphosphate-related phosphatase domain-containing protein n=1 Tax=Taxus chinensis TaxID=29808 RepID=A0AA38GPV2_TAXCH|nr:hypothetical protein KI387_006211 [Taxus chinensis]